MGKKIEISIEKLLSIMPTLIITQEDLSYIFTKKDIRDQFYKLYRMYVKGDYDISLLEDFIKDNKEYIDKENLVLILAKNCKYQLEVIDEEIAKAVSQKGNTVQDKKVELVTITELKKRKKITEETMREVSKIGKGLNRILTFYRYSDEQEQYDLDVADSRELIDKKHISAVKKLKTFENIDNTFKDEEADGNIGMLYILQVLSISDLKEIFPIQDEDVSNDNISDKENKARKFGINVMEYIYDMKLLLEKDISYKELKRMKQQDSNLYFEHIKEIEDEDYTLYMKEVLKKYIKYVDMDKLLLISAYRYNYGFEQQQDKEKTKGYHAIIELILDNIENKNAKLSCKLEYTLGDKRVAKPVEYSVKDLEKFSKRFVDDKYVSDKEIKKFKPNIENGEMSLKDIDSRYIDIAFSQEELEKYSIMSMENLEYVANKLGWDKEEIIQRINNIGQCSNELLKGLIEKQILDAQNIVKLYLSNKLTIEQIKEIKNSIDLSEFVNSSELIQYYKNSIEKDTSEKEDDQLNRFEELYKEIRIKDVASEELEENHNNLVNSLLDTYKGEEYVKVVEELYKKDLISLEVLAEWNGEEIINKFYNYGTITLEDIEKLVKENKLSFEYISNLYSKIVNQEDIEYEKRFEYIKKGFITEEEIFKMYHNNLIFENDLRVLSDQGIIKKDTFQKVINARTRDDLEKKSHIRLVGLDMLTKRKNEIYSNTMDRTEQYPPIQENKNSKLIIDPNERLEFLKLFKAYRAETDLDEDSPFYNYEFYVIPDESGDIGLNSVVIAEKYYEDKETEEKFAVNNATYFFKYKDLMVLSKLNKSEMTKERKNIVFTANHTLATAEKNGHWAASVIYAITKTMLSSELKEYSKENQRKIVLQKLNEVYNENEILEILDMASKIDRGEYIYEIVNPNDTVLKKTKVTEYKSDDSKSR